MIIIDILTSALQSIVFGYTINYCIDKKDELHKIKLYLMILIFFIIGSFLSGNFGDNWGTCIFAPHILALCTVVLFYRKNNLNVITGHTIAYFTMQVCTLIFGGIIFEGVNEIINAQYINYMRIVIIYIPQWIVLFFYLKHMDKIREIYKLIIIEKFCIEFLGISFILDFVMTFYMLSLGAGSQLIKNIIYILFFIFATIVIVYFWRINQKSKQIYELNQSLEIKNNELRKIKHDYGAQISYLYGLCLMERSVDLKIALKDIINNNESTSTAVEISDNKESLLSLALKPAVDQGIHVIVEEKCDFKLVSMEEIQLYRIISNIVNNAIRAMNGKGIIIAKTYEYSGNIIIKIENNGPKIEEGYLQDIFKLGFTTKDNSDKSHGFGLHIVKNLVERCNGKISVKSTDESTQFKIVLPIK